MGAVAPAQPRRDPGDVRFDFRAAAAVHHREQVVRPQRRMPGTKVAVADEGERADPAARLRDLRIIDVPHRHAVGAVAEGVVVRHRGDAPDRAGVEHALQAPHDLGRIEAGLRGDGMAGAGDQRQPCLGGGDDGAVGRVERSARRRGAAHFAGRRPTRGPALAGVELEPDVVLLQLRHVVDRASGVRRDRFEDRRDRGRRLGGEHEPQVQLVLALVVVRHLLEGVDGGGDRIEPFGRDLHGGEGDRPAKALGVVHRPEAGEHAVREQAAQPPDEDGFLHPQRLGRRRERTLAHRHAVLQRVDDGAVEIIHGPRPPSPRMRGPGRGGRRAGGSSGRRAGGTGGG